MRKHRKLPKNQTGVPDAEAETELTKEYIVDYLSLANRDILVYNEGGYSERYVYNLSSQRLSLELDYLASTKAGESGENLISDVAVSVTTKITYRSNILGSDVMGLDESGEVVLHMEYDEWGKPLGSTAFTSNEAGLDKSFFYTGYTYDTTLDLYFAQNRFYSAELRRFTQQDPIKDGLNWYAYVGNNPANGIDPWGLLSAEEGGGSSNGGAVNTPNPNYNVAQAETSSSDDDTLNSGNTGTPTPWVSSREMLEQSGHQYALQMMSQEQTAANSVSSTSGLEEPQYIEKFQCPDPVEVLTAVAIFVAGVLFATMVVSFTPAMATLVGGAAALAGVSAAAVTVIETGVLIAGSVIAAGATVVTAAEMLEATSGYNHIRDGALVGDLGMSQNQAEQLYSDIKFGVVAAGAVIIAGGFFYTEMMAGNQAPTLGANQGQLTMNNSVLPPNTLTFDSNQLGAKWGKHLFDYPEMNSYHDYQQYAQEVFRNYDFWTFSSVTNEFCFIKGQDLLRVNLSGAFVSLYPGAASKLVSDALSLFGMGG